MGDHDQARRAYAEALRRASTWQCWSNLSALALGLKDFDAALANARKAIGMAPAQAEAWVNAGVACWHAGARKDGARAMAHAVELAPANATAAIDYAYMLRSVDRVTQAYEVMRAARECGTRTAALLRAMAELERILGRFGDCRQHALEALQLMANEGLPSPALPELPAQLPHSLEAWRGVLEDCLRRLAPLRCDPCMAGGAVRIYALHGGLPEPRKDIDIVVDSRVGHDALRAAFADGYRPFARQGQIAPSGGAIGVLGLVHEASGIPIDIMLQDRSGGRWRGSFGAPDHLVFDTPAFSIVEEARAGMQVPLPLPQPLDEYLQWIYGDDWALPTQMVAGTPVPREFIQKGLHSPGIASASRPAALNRALLSLLTALHEGQMRSAAALCHQILAVEQQDAVREVQARLSGGRIR